MLKSLPLPSADLKLSSEIPWQIVQSCFTKPYYPFVLSITNARMFECCLRGDSSLLVAGFGGSLLCTLRFQVSSWEHSKLTYHFIFLIELIQSTIHFFFPRQSLKVACLWLQFILCFLNISLVFQFTGSPLYETYYKQVGSSKKLKCSFLFPQISLSFLSPLQCQASVRSLCWVVMCACVTPFDLETRRFISRLCFHDSHASIECEFLPFR